MYNKLASISFIVMAFLCLGSASLAQNVEYKSGLVADVYIEDAKSGTWASAARTGILIGSYIDEGIAEFSLSRIKKEPALAGLIEDNLIGVEWNGFIEMAESGQYVILMKIKTTGYPGVLNSCNFEIYLDGEKFGSIGKKAGAVDGGLNDDTSSKIVAAEFEKGKHAFRVWHHCGVKKGSWRSWPEGVGSVILYFEEKGPLDRLPSKVSADRFYWK